MSTHLQPLLQILLIRLLFDHVTVNNFFYNQICDVEGMNNLKNPQKDHYQWQSDLNIKDPSEVGASRETPVFYLSMSFYEGYQENVAWYGLYEKF